MKAILIPVVLLLIGLGAGVGAGIMLGAGPAEEEVAEGEGGEEASSESEDSEDAEEPVDPDSVEFARLGNQFIVPIVSSEEVNALVVLSITLEVTPGGTETVFSNEPRLRDRMLSVLFDHANSGGFDSSFTQTATLEKLRNGLREAARRVLGDILVDVLIIDIVRQEV
ncbi:MAG: flagellar basal body-associated FliL family protein [Pseudomonadota bacterium]